MVYDFIFGASSEKTRKEQFYNNCRKRLEKSQCHGTQQNLQICSTPGTEKKTESSIRTCIVDAMQPSSIVESKSLVQTSTCF